MSGLCSERKQKEIADLLACNSIDIVTVQESWEKEDKLISLLHEVELVACNGRQLVSEPEWTRVRPVIVNGRAINGGIGECDSR